MDLDPLLSKSQGFLTELVSPLSSEQIAMPAASESEIAPTNDSCFPLTK